MIIKLLMQLYVNFEIIGEASKNIPDELKTMYKDVPWKEMYYLRNKVSQWSILELTKK
ncbi:MAG: hypothetical protein IPH97_16335 [Ignavibacteriales bacterium]|nr:hypothetical protein [Ignavibacteriales bacterium]